MALDDFLKPNDQTLLKILMRQEEKDKLHPLIRGEIVLFPAKEGEGAHFIARVLYPTLDGFYASIAANLEPSVTEEALQATPIKGLRTFNKQGNSEVFKGSDAINFLQGFQSTTHYADVLSHDKYKYS